MSNISDQLASLATDAPPALAGRIMKATGTGRFYDTISGPTGSLIVGWSTRGIYGIAPAAELERFVAQHTEDGLAPAPEDMPSRLRKQARRAIDSGKLGSLAIDLTSLTEFQQAVLRKTAEIPAGQLRPYSWVAREIGKPGATRAVGSALNKNPVPVLIPCHRVGKSDGTVGQYAYGPEMKRALLRHEGLDPDAVDEAAARGVRFVASATTGIYCHPTCHHARRIQEGNRIELHSAGEARARGMRGCLTCRPAVAA